MWTITKRRVAVSCSIMLFLAFLLLLGAAPSQGQSPDSSQKEYWPLFQGVNLCAYKDVIDYSGSSIMAWICGSVDKRSTKIKYDCCPGYKRTPIANNECVEEYQTYMPIILTLTVMKKVECADILFKVASDLDKDGKDLTVFVPDKDDALQNISETDITNLIVDGRHYSSKFRNGANIITKSGYPLKVSTYRNGLVFVECQLLTKPDYETSNGVIHITGGPIDASGRFLTVLQRLQDDPDLSEFTADIPHDLRSQFAATNSQKRYTVFAPTNRAWQTAKRDINDPQVISDLVKLHVQDGLVCGLSLDDQKRLLGPSMLHTYISGSLKPDGSRVLTDTCNSKVTFQKMDMMAGNGVVHKLNSALQSLTTMDYPSALDCLADGLNPQLSPGARQMAVCGIQVQPGGNWVVLLPTPKALHQSSGDCTLYQNHILTSRDCKMKNRFGIGTRQECLYTTKYTTPNGDNPTVTNQYIRTRVGSRLHFGTAITTSLRPILFRDGVIYSVSSVNLPPDRTMMQIIREYPTLSITYEKIQKAGFGEILTQNSPNVVFFAPSNYAWMGEAEANTYAPKQLRKFFEMHAFKHQLIFAKNGNVDSETVQNLKSLSGTYVKLRRNLDGSTFINCAGMDPHTWPMTTRDSIVASDGIITIIDWALSCKDSSLEF